MAKVNRKLQRGLSSVVFRLLQRENVCFLLAFWVTEIPLGRCHCLLLPPSCWKRLCPAIFKIFNSCFVFSEVFQAHVAARRAGSTSDLWVLCLENLSLLDIQENGLLCSCRAESRGCRREGRTPCPPGAGIKVRGSAGLCCCLTDDPSLCVLPGFEITIDHPHTHVVKCTQLVRGKRGRVANTRGFSSL